jgi:hypothetical protein
MGAKQRVRATAKRPVSQEVLDRYAVVKPITFPEWKAQQERQQRAAKRQQEAA